MTAAEKSDLFINILNAGIDPYNHPYWNKTWLHDAVDRFQNYSFSDSEEERYIKELSQKGAYAEKAMLCYSYTQPIASNTSACVCPITMSEHLTDKGSML